MSRIGKQPIAIPAKVKVEVKGQKVQVEGGLLESLGYAGGEIGDHLPDWLALIAPDDVGDVESRLNAHLTGMSSSFEAEFRMKAKNGSVRWIHSPGSPLRHF